MRSLVLSALTPATKWWNPVWAWRHALSCCSPCFPELCCMSLFSRLHFPVMQLRVVLFFFFFKEMWFPIPFCPGCCLEQEMPVRMWVCSNSCVIHTAVNSAAVAEHTPFVQADLMAVVQLLTSCERSYPLRCTACALSTWRWSCVILWKQYWRKI